MNKNEHLIELLRENKVIKLGKFTLSSGRESDYYVDMKRAITNPSILGEAAKLISEEIDKSEVDIIAGPALGAIPIVTAVSLYTGKPMIMIRKARKDYGTSQQIEGDLHNGDRVVVLEDVTTTGNSLKDAIQAISDNGGQVIMAFAVVDRMEGALENLQEKGIIFKTLVSVKDLL